MKPSTLTHALFAGALLFLCVGRLVAQDVILVIDNSASMVASNDAGTREALRTFYRSFLTDALASGQGLSNVKGLKIVPLGAAEGKLEVIDGSNQSAVVSRVRGVFGFRDLFTRIERTLVNLEDSRLIASSNRILIVSDMAPDHDNEGSLWSFSREDVLDLRQTVAILDRWLASGKQLDIALLGWNEIPTATGGYGSLAPYLADLEASNQLSNGRTEVEEGLALLRALHPDRVKYRAVSTNNIGEDFSFLLCDLFEIQDQEFCPTVSRTDFLVRTTFDAAFNFQPDDFAWYENSRVKDLYCGGKRNLRYRYQPYLDPDGPSEGDVQFEVRAMGDADPYRKAEVEAKIRKRDGAFDDQTRASREDLGKEFGSRKMVMKWVSRVVAEELCTLINRHYPPPRTRKSFVLVDYEGRKLAPGIRFGVKMHFAGPEPTSWSERTRVRQNGFAQVFLRRDLIRGEAALLWREPGEQGQNREIPLLEISPAHVQTRFPLSIAIPRDRFVDCRVLSPASFDLNVVRRDGTEETMVKWQELTAGEWEVPVLPGSYYWEAVPTIDRNLLASYHASVDVGKGECVIRLLGDQDDLREGQNIDAYFEQFEGNADDREHLPRSSWFFYALFQHTSKALANQGPGAENRLMELWGTVFELIFGTEENPAAPAWKRRIAYRGLPEIGLKEEHELFLLRAAMNRFLRRDDILSGTNRNRYRDWLESVKGNGPDYPVGEKLAKRLSLD